MPRKRAPALSRAGRYEIDKKTIEWDTGKILELIDRSVKENKLNLFLLMIGGVICLAAGTCFLLWSKSGKGLVTGIVCLISGCIAPFPYLLDLIGNDLKRNAAVAKKLILEKPVELVWAHPLERKTDSGVDKFWLLKFRNGINIEIPLNLFYENKPDYLEEQNIKNFTEALEKINPAIAIGYTEGMMRGMR